MRAARVLDMLLLLQRRGRLTAAQLGAALEVSERTVLRDVEALSEAGVPVYTRRGAGGGIELLDGFETRLTGLTPQEAACLHLAGQPEVAHRLGLGAPTRAVRHKLDAALPPALVAQADELASWFLHDPDPWSGGRVPHGELRRVASCIRSRRRVELYLGDGGPVLVEPVALVLKAGCWHLVVLAPRRDEERSARVVCLDSLRATRLTRQRFSVPEDFRLGAFWAAYVGARRGVRTSRP